MGDQEATVELPTRLRGVCERLRSLLASATRSDVHLRYRAGRMLLKVKRGPGTYGVGAVETLARELGRDAATLYRYALVPERWSPRRMKLLVARRTPVGEPLSWSHWVELARVESGPLRDRLTEHALCEGLSVRELVRRIDEASEQAEPCAAQPSLRETLLSLASLAERLAAQVSGGLEEVLGGDRVMSLRRSEIDALFGRAIDAHSGLQERVQGRLDDLRGARTRLARGEAVAPQSGARALGTHGSLLSGGGKG